MNSKSIKQSYIQAAHIVSRYGDKYLPIFERLELEYQNSLEKNALLTKAEKIAIDNEVD